MQRFVYLWNGILIHIILYQMRHSCKGQNCPSHGYYNISQFGDACQYRCRCVNEEQCDRLTGNCTNGCARGWMGPGCQYRNLAVLRDGTSHHSTCNSSDDDAMLANDGNITTCSSCFTGSDDPWWRIDFLKVHYIVGLVLKIDGDMDIDIRIEGSNDTEFDKSTLCYQQKITTFPSELEIMCYDTMAVQHIRIIVTNESKTFVMCEVEIYGGRYISYMGDVSQTTQFSGWPMASAAAAVDGRPMLEGDKQEDDASRTCAVTEWGNMENWRLMFSHTMFLQGIDVYGRMLSDNLEFTSQLAGFRLNAITSNDQLLLLYTDNPAGANWRDYQPLMIELAVPVNSTGVSIFNNPNTVDHLSLCEVDVFAECTPGQCGWNCSDVCNCSTITTGSYRKDGRCPYGCIPRWTGQNGRCDHTCPDDTWGLNCTLVCYCSPGSLCDIDNGTCPGECAVGWKGIACNKSCDNNTYGQNCSESCGMCLDNAQCDAINGHCPGLCDHGLEGIFCNETCSDYFYGISCSSSCGHCLDSEVCNKSTGRCPSACEPGYEMPFCRDGCSEYRYGQHCNETCGNCKNDEPCNARTGQCSAGCQTGWSGFLCKDVCEDFLFGQNCNNSCGRCNSGSTCNTQTGECEAGCDAGMLPPLCTSDCPRYTYGYNCRVQCVLCKDNRTCNASGDECQNRCDSGYHEDRCEETIRKSSKDFPIIPIIAGISALTLCCICAIIVIVIIRLCRNRNAANGDNNVYFEPDAMSGTGENDEYEMIESK